MARLAVYQPTIGRGGMEAVCMNALAALGDDHDLTLWTLTTPDFDALNEFFDTDVTPPTVRRLDRSGRAVAASHNLLSDANLGLGRLHAALLGRLLRRCADEYDLVVSTYGELALEHPAVEYVHYPTYNRHRLPAEIDTRGSLRRAYDRACDLAGGHHGRSPDGTLLANSDWTAGVVEAVHGRRPRTVYPPVDTRAFAPQPWPRREPGFVVVGRVAPRKRTHVAVEVVRRLHRAGYDVPLRVVGPVDDRRYYRRLRRRVDDDRIQFEGAVDRERLVELLCTHRYGLHATLNEHFGMAVAEFVAAGMVPFVHDSGGQREVVGELSELRYGSVDDAVSKVAAVLDTPSGGQTLREGLPDVKKRFGRDRFRRELRAAVEETLERQTTSMER